MWTAWWSTVGSGPTRLWMAPATSGNCTSFWTNSLSSKASESGVPYGTPGMPAFSTSIASVFISSGTTASIRKAPVATKCAIWTEVSRFL